MQIGPRIRIGGSVGKIGQNVKNAVTKGVSDVAHTVAPIAAVAAPFIPGIGGLLAKGVGMIPGLGGAADAVGGFLGEHGEEITTGLAGIDAARQQQQARDTQQGAIDYAKNSYDGRAPLRTAGQAGMLNPQAPPALQALRSRANRGNPYGVPAIAPAKAG